MTRISRRGVTAAPVLLYGLFGVFVAATAYLIASSLTRRSVLTYAPTPASSVSARGRGSHDSVAIDTLTIDATNTDRWTYVSLTRHAVLASADTAGWELAVRRYQVRSSGRVSDVGVTGLDRVARADDNGGHAAASSELGHWYRYSWLTHLLEPSGHVYEIHTSGGRTFALQIISYYCPGPTAGCLTVRYVPIR
jgi:hypothetical protein